MNDEWELVAGSGIEGGADGVDVIRRHNRNAFEQPADHTSVEVHAALRSSISLAAPCGSGTAALVHPEPSQCNANGWLDTLGRRVWKIRVGERAVAALLLTPTLVAVAPVAHTSTSLL